jgi:adenine-specific DNA glycosylase
MGESRRRAHVTSRGRTEGAWDAGLHADSDRGPIDVGLAIDAQAVGVVVDTHVGRISRRLGLSRHADPLKVERDLMAAVPAGHWIAWSHRLIEHGRTVCMARRPRCEACPLADLCPRVGLQGAGQRAAGRAARGKK